MNRHALRVQVFVGGKSAESMTTEKHKRLADHIPHVSMPVYIAAAEEELAKEMARCHEGEKNGTSK